MTMTEARGTDTGVTWKEAVEEARAKAEILPEVLGMDASVAIELAEEKLPEHPTPDAIDTAVLELQGSLPWSVEETLECRTPSDRRTADCIRALAAEVFELRDKVAALEGARS